MKLQEVCNIRTGVVVSRFRPTQHQTDCFQYKLLSLKAITANGSIDYNQIETIMLAEEMRPEYLTQLGDILVRLSMPYTAVLIKDQSQCGLLIPSHFAIIRADTSKTIPSYLYWLLQQEQTRQQLTINSSGSTMLGTISVGTIAELKFKPISIDKQKAIGELLLLAEQEQSLLMQLATCKKIYYKAVLEKINNER